MIFWETKSFKAFQNFLKTHKNKINKLGLSEKNFETINIKFKRQKRINERKMYNRLSGINNPLSFILVFELDHKTKFSKNIIPSFKKQISVIKQNWQHFSNLWFLELLISAVEKFESED